MLDLKKTSMLKSLFIKNYVLIKQLDIDFAAGFSAFTGETGAGKSIIVGALSLILGNRADYSAISSNEKKCEISALFDVSKNSLAQNWLQQQEIEHNNEIECRRVITVDGRSKSWINSRPCTNASLKLLGSLLVQIHGQHDQIKLNNAKYQLSVIDETGQYQQLLRQVSDLSGKFRQVCKELSQIELAGALNDSESQLLRYQYEELSQLNLTEHELDNLHLQQKMLTGASNNLSNMDKSLALLTGDHNNVNQIIAEIISALSEIDGDNLNGVLKMLDEVSINLNEVESELQNQYDNIEVNPEKLILIENRLEQIYSTARKHQVNVEYFYQHFLQLGNKLELNDSQKLERTKLLTEKQSIESAYNDLSLQLSQARCNTAQIFQQKVTDIIQQLGLVNAKFSVKINHTPDAIINNSGQDSCDFEITMNPGQSPQIMSKTASGGELSRIALAVEICKNQEQQSSSFVFDEVDAGIGGAVAETVGKLMRKLSLNQQVFAVTHLPQVAGLSHQHFLVSKAIGIDGATQSALALLNNQQRIHELARMSGGSNITKATLQQAKAFMLN